MNTENNTIYDASEAELLHGKDTAPGRVRTFLLEPDKKTAPHSCTLFVWQNNLADLLRFVTVALKGGAGVKIVFPRDAQIDTITRPELNWGITIDSTHPEYDRVSALTNFYHLDDDTYRSSTIGLTDLHYGDEYIVDDSIEAPTGIIDSWIAMLFAANQREPIIFDLSRLRPIGTTNSNGLVASGAKSFAELYIEIANHLKQRTIGSLLKLLGKINDTMRRGGYKRGIITSEMDYRCPLIDEYLAVPTTELPGSHKKGVTIDKGILAADKVDLLERAIASRNSEGTFFGKVTPEGIYHNVCMGLQLAHRGTCTIWRVNLGACAIEDLIPAFTEATRNICELHVTWRDRVRGGQEMYAPIEADRQVGLDVMGLANLLKRYEITYEQFTTDLEKYITIGQLFYADASTERVELVYALHQAYRRSVKAADDFMTERGLPILDRIHTVEPAQSHAYECLDYEGKTVCRGIFPPQGRVVLRKSNSQLNKRYFHGNVETISQVGPILFERLCNAWQKMMDSCRRSHSISQDTYRICDRDRVEEFLTSPAKTWYYSEHNNLDQYGFLGKNAQTATSAKQFPVACDLNAGARCSTCEE